jgi:hypothetical protein
MRLLLLAVAALPLAACATVVRGTNEEVAFQSEPPGAAVQTSTGLSCPETPCTIAIPRKDPFLATFTKPGYQPTQVMVGTQIQGGGTAGLVGNAVAGGPIGVVVDASSGAAMDHVPNPVIASLVPSALPSAQRRRPPRRHTPTSQLPQVPQT